MSEGVLPDDEAYSRFFGLRKTAERRFTDELLTALARVDRALLPKAASHPLAAKIVEGPPALDALVALVERGAPQQRLDAIDAFRRGALQERLDAIDAFRRGALQERLDAIDAAAHVLLSMDEAPKEVVRRLRAVLQQERDPELIALITKALAIGRDPALMVEQLQRLGDDDPGIVASAARLLGFGRFRPAVPVLQGLVSPDRFYESRHVIWALGEIGDPAALPTLDIALANAFRVVDALIAVGKIGSIISFPKVTPHLVSSPPEQKDAAARALAMILDVNRALVARQPAIKDVLVPMIEGQLADPLAPLSGSTRFHMLLCLARLAHPLDAARVKKYLGVTLDDDDAQAVAMFAKSGQGPTLTKPTASRLKQR